MLCWLYSFEIKHTGFSLVFLVIFFSFDLSIFWQLISSSCTNYKSEKIFYSIPINVSKLVRLEWSVLLAPLPAYNVHINTQKKTMFVLFSKKNLNTTFALIIWCKKLSSTDVIITFKIISKIYVHSIWSFGMYIKKYSSTDCD